MSSESIEHYQRLLYKYELTYEYVNTHEYDNERVHVKYGNKSTVNMSLKVLQQSIEVIKFIHDNREYFVEMLLANGYNDIINSIRYVRGGLIVDIFVNYIYVSDDKFRFHIFEIATMYDKLRDLAIGIDVSYKPVIKNE